MPNESPYKVNLLHTVLNVAVALVALYWVFSRTDWPETWRSLADSNYWWFLLGFGLFYLTLPLRAWRWRILLDNVGVQMPLSVLTGVIFRAWTINAALPGRAGDLYSAYALKTERNLDASVTLGTVFCARVLDLLTLVVLVAAVYLLGFRQTLPGSFGQLVAVAVGLGFMLTLVVIMLARWPQAARRLIPRRLRDAFTRFAGAALGSYRRGPLLLGITTLLWALEAVRLWCVMAAVGVMLPAPQVVFLALAAAILSTLPLSPGGLGTIEVLYRQFLPYAGVPSELAGGIIILDRIINYWFILVAGGLYFLWLRRPLGKGSQE